MDVGFKIYKDADMKNCSLNISQIEEKLETDLTNQKFNIEFDEFQKD